MSSHNNDGANNMKVEIKNNYGREAIYPVDDEAKIFATIAGTKTLTRETLALVKKLNIAIEVVQPQVNF
jgi:hypothetical protein